MMTQSTTRQFGVWSLVCSVACGILVTLFATHFSADVLKATRGDSEKTVPQQKPAPHLPSALAPDNRAKNVRLPGVEPKDEDSKLIMDQWLKAARSDGRIPGKTVGALEWHIKQYSTIFPRLATILSRFDATRDWTEAEAVGLLNSVTEITSLPLNTLNNQYRFGKPANIRMGKALPADLADVLWGEPHQNGLRSACLVEPSAKEVAVGSLMKVRVLIQNAGKESQTFLFPLHAVPDGLRASNAQVHIVPWTYGIFNVRVRLDPGHYIELESFDVAIEERYDDTLRSDLSRVVLVSRPGSDLRLSFTVGLTEQYFRQLDGLEDPEAIRLRTIANRVMEEAPLPASVADRELILRQVVLDMFGEPPTADEIAEFAVDHSPETLTKLTARLQARQAKPLFVGEVPSNEVTIRVVPKISIKSKSRQDSKQ